MAEQVDCVVVGAGVVGLAVARALALRGREVLVLEAAPTFGTGTSARNSEVIHAGLYYPQGSLKARLCVRGRDLLYAFCAGRGIAHRRCGKLIVATSEAQLGRLDALQAQAQANGVHDLQRLSAEQAREMEPALACVAALWSPSTGIVDSHGLMLALLADAEAAGAVLALKSPVQAIEAIDAGRGGYRVTIAGETLQVRRLVNAAGLVAPDLAMRLQGRPPGAPRPPEAHFCKGSYFTFAGRAPFSRLIYPVPEAAGLGVHVTLDLGGQMRFGPDVEWLDIPSEAQIDYQVDARRQAGMAEAIRRYWPGLPEGALQPGHAGVRPKISGPQAPSADFRIDTEAVHGLPGLVELLGIESPGLTASLAIGEQVAAALGDALH